MNTIPIDLTPEEEFAITALRGLSKIWPKSLWLFSASGSLNVMKTNENGLRAINPKGCVDQNYSIETIDIPNDGGDW
jgi:hypothetical protein